MMADDNPEDRQREWLVRCRLIKWYVTRKAHLFAEMFSASIWLTAHLFTFEPALPLLGALLAFYHNSTKLRFPFSTWHVRSLFPTIAAYSLHFCALVTLSRVACLLANMLPTRERLTAQSTARE